MHIVEHAAQELAAIPGIEHRTLAGAAEGLEHLSVWLSRMGPSAVTPVHRHDCEEVVVVTAGEGEVESGGEVRRFKAPATLTIPPNVVHQIRNTGAETLELVAAFSVSPVRVEDADGQVIALPWRT